MQIDRAIGIGTTGTVFHVIFHRVSCCRELSPDLVIIARMSYKLDNVIVIEVSNYLVMQ
jgi:hypothetical protein